MSFKIIEELQKQVADLERRQSEMKPKVVTEETKVDAKELQTRGANAYLFQTLTGREMKDEVLATRAMNPEDFPEWAAEQFKNDLIERMRLIANVEGMFQQYTIPQGVQNLSIPKRKGALKAYLIAPSQDAINSAIQSAKVTFDAKSLMTMAPIADQANDEVVVALLEVTKQQIAESLVDGMENALINGDTTAGASNINGQTIGDDITSQERTFDGIRKITEDRHTTPVGSGGAPSKIDLEGTLSFNNLMKMKAMMWKESVKTSDLVYIVSPATYHKLPTSIPEMLTLDKYGPAASVITGEVAKIGGVPVVVSEFVPENLGADGKYSATGDKTIVILLNKKMFATATRGGAKYESDRRIENRTNIFTGHRDVDFKELVGELGIVSSVIGYNIPAEV